MDLQATAGEPVTWGIGQAAIAGARERVCQPAAPAVRFAGFLIQHRRMDAPTPKKPLSQTVKQIGALSTVGFSFVLAVGLGVWLGLLLDRWLDTSPWFFFIFFVFGLVAGAMNVYRTAGKFLK
jgi:ATP synthase protein I